MSQNSNTSFKPQKNASKVHSLVSSLILALTLFVVLLGCFELIARTNQFKQRFPLRSVGSYHSQFEIKWFKLQDFEERYGGVDVILLGNSMINTGIDAEILAQDYLSATGINLRIFNFGIEGLTVAPNADLAKILMQEFNPGSIIFVTEMRDYVAKNGLSVSQKFLSNPWIQEKLGQPVTLHSWLRVNSHAAQYLLPYRNWSRFDFLDNVFMSTKRIGDTTATGYEADRNLGENVDKHPDPNDPNEAANFELYQNFSIDPGRLKDLKNILDYTLTGTQVIVTEMPVYPTYFDYFGGESVHLRYLAEIELFIEEHGGTFLPAIRWELIPIEGRVDNHHLNYIGAPLFTHLFAQELSEACLQQELCLLTAPDFEVSKWP